MKQNTKAPANNAPQHRKKHKPGKKQRRHAGEFTTEKHNAGPFAPAAFKSHEVKAAVELTYWRNKTDPFAAGRAKNLIAQGILRPSDIIEGVAV